MNAWRALSILGARGIEQRRIRRVPTYGIQRAIRRSQQSIGIEPPGEGLLHEDHGVAALAQCGQHARHVEQGFAVGNLSRDAPAERDALLVVSLNPRPQRADIVARHGQQVAAFARTDQLERLGSLTLLEQDERVEIDRAFPHGLLGVCTIAELEYD